MSANSRILAARALSQVRRALYAVRRARWRIERSRVADQDLIRYLRMLELVLERIAIRLETIATTGILSPSIVALPLALIREASKLVQIPEAEPIIGDIEITLASLLEATVQEPPQALLTAASSEAKRILREIEEGLLAEGPVRSPSQADTPPAKTGGMESGPQSEGPLEE